nr:immunoglobulin heavy chain junction region [Macaca mulatta]
CAGAGRGFLDFW